MTRSFLSAQREAANLVKSAEKFSLNVPLVGKVAVPEPDKLALFAVLGLLAAIELIDWPVAVAAGVGHVLVAQHFEERQRDVSQCAEQSGRND